MTRFFIVAAPRTGSNLLCTLLDSHPDVLCHHELYNPNGIFYALRLRGGGFSLGTVEERNVDPVGFLSRIWGAHLGHRCIGFKMTRGQDQSVLDTLLADVGVHTIVLRRANRLKTYVSELRAQATGQWEVYDPAELAASPSRVRVDAGALYRHIADNEQFYAALEAALGRSGAPALRVTYEELFCDDEHRRILSFLGVGHAGVSLRAASVKQNSCDLRELIDNYDELAESIHRTDLGAELDDPRP